MALSIFEDKAKLPVEEELKTVLKETYPFWQDLKSFVHENYKPVLEEWKHSGKNYGWGFRLRDKKRVIIYMTPCEGYFNASLVFGEKATKQAFESNISQEIKRIIDEAPVYAEGRGFRVYIKGKEYLGDLKELIMIKLNN